MNKNEQFKKRFSAAFTNSKVNENKILGNLGSEKKLTETKAEFKPKYSDLVLADHFWWYTASVIARLFVETGFTFIQLQLFGLKVPELYKCKKWPCPNTVDCFISRPTEKTIFLWFMLIYSCFCVLMNLAEAIYLCQAFFKNRISKSKLQLISKQRCFTPADNLRDLIPNNCHEKDKRVYAPLCNGKPQYTAMADDLSSRSSRNQFDKKAWHVNGDYKGRRDSDRWIKCGGRGDNGNQDFIAIMLESEEERDENAEIEMARAEEDDINDMEQYNADNLTGELNVDDGNDDGGQDCL